MITGSLDWAPVEIGVGWTMGSIHRLPAEGAGCEWFHSK
jgi:hypothetical protein